MARYRHNPDDPRRRHNLDDVYAYIVRHMTETAGRPPTIREICAACGISSTSAVSYALRSLEQTGRIKLVDGWRIRIPGATWRMPEAANLDAQDVANAVRYWQSYPDLHPLTCGNDSSHALLVPRLAGDAVSLACPDCDYRQTHIPVVVLERYRESLSDTSWLAPGDGNV